VVASGEAEHEEVVAERDEEEGRVEDADAEETEASGLVGEAEEVVEEGFQVFEEEEGNGDWEERESGLDGRGGATRRNDGERG
jgi:hypothetical protein